MEVPGINDVIAAQDLLGQNVRKTPIFESTSLNKCLGGHRILFKAECMQRVGAFKARGACHTLLKHIKQHGRPELVIASSSGNHSQAVAWAASSQGIPSKIFMPKNVSSIKLQATRSYGAEVDLCDNRDEADRLVLEASKAENVLWIPPYDHVDVALGAGTAALEVLQDEYKAEAFFAPCGGGGLLSGTYLAAKGFDPSTKVFGVEPAAADDAYQSRQEGKIIRLEKSPETMADGAKTMSVGAITFEYIIRLDDLFRAEEDDISYWTQWLTHFLKLHIEPTSAMTMVGVCKWLKQLPDSEPRTVCVILSGGNIDREKILQIYEKDWLGQVPCL